MERQPKSLGGLPQAWSPLETVQRDSVLGVPEGAEDELWEQLSLPGVAQDLEEPNR